MTEQTELMEIIGELITEEIVAVTEFVQEELMPLIEYREEAEKKAFDRFYKNLKQMEEI